MSGVKQRRDRFTFMDSADRFTEQRSDTDDFDFAIESIDTGHRVGGDQLFDFRSGKQFLSADVTEQAVGNRGINFGSTVSFQNLCRGFPLPAQ